MHVGFQRGRLNHSHHLPPVNMFNTNLILRPILLEMHLRMKRFLELCIPVKLCCKTTMTEFHALCKHKITGRENRERLVASLEETSVEPGWTGGQSVNCDTDDSGQPCVWTGDYLITKRKQRPLHTPSPLCFSPSHHPGFNYHPSVGWPLFLCGFSLYLSTPLKTMFHLSVTLTLY